MTKKTKILLVEDDPNFGSVLKNYLELNEYEVLLAPDGFAGYDQFISGKYDICILDVMMPRKDGFTLAKEIREKDMQVPIIFLTAKTMKDDMLTGFKSGADDYISKPISPKVFLSRVNALFRRLNKNDARILIIDHVTIDPERYIIKVRENEIVLAKKEFELLYLLALKPGRVFLRHEILNQVWGNNVIVGDRTIDVHIRKIRQKLGVDCITTVKGVGYKFEL